MADRVATQKLRTVAFLAENDISFLKAPKLIEFSRKLAEDKAALSRLTMSNSQASYTTTFGLGRSLKDKLRIVLKDHPLSINADEATSDNNQKFINVLGRYYDEEQNMVVTRHIGTRGINTATAKLTTDAIESILSEVGVGWHQVTSALFDNCSVMRGVKSGVESRIREQNPYLLDCSGDTVHMVNNAAKAFLSPFENVLEDFASHVYYDIEKSPKQKDILEEIQSLLHVDSKSKRYISLVRPISSRFLQMLDVADRLSQLHEVLLMFYFGHLSKEEQSQWRYVLYCI